jgi:hypothetical protein
MTNLTHPNFMENFTRKGYKLETIVGTLWQGFIAKNIDNLPRVTYLIDI